MRRPIVSVIIPTYNRASSLQRAIRSVLAQTFSDLEVLVIDDASTVNVGEVVEEFGDKRIEYARHSRNKGVATAKNTGIRMATGQYIAFLDDDDVYAEEKIERQLTVFEESPPSVGLVYCSAAFITGDGRILGRKDTGNQSSDVSCHIDDIGPTPLVRRVCFDEVGLFDESFRCFEDWDMWLRVSHGYDLRSCPEPLYIVPQHSSPRLTNNLDTMLESLDRIYKKHSHRLESLPKREKKRMYSKYHKTRAVSFYHAGKIRKGNEDAIQAFLLNPVSIKLWKLVIVGLPGSRFYRLSRAVQRTLASKLRLQQAVEVPSADVG